MKSGGGFVSTHSQRKLSSHPFEQWHPLAPPFKVENFNIFLKCIMSFLKNDLNQKWGFVQIFQKF